MRYRNGKDGDKDIIPFDGVRLVACCDCGLVHKHVYSIEDGKIVERVYRDNRATAGIRRAMARKHEIIAETAANIYVILRRIVHKRKPGKVVAEYETY